MCLSLSKTKMWKASYYCPIGKGIEGVCFVGTTSQRASNWVNFEISSTLNQSQAMQPFLQSLIPEVNAVVT